MDDPRFDRLAKQWGARLTRRVAFGPLAVTGLGAWLAQTEPTAAKRRKQNKKKKKQRVYAGVRLIEQLAQTMARQTGDCAALETTADQFRLQHQGRLAQLLQDEATWGPVRRDRMGRAYGARITRAAESLHAMMATCGYRGAGLSADDSPICLATGSDRPLPEIDALATGGCSGCDCGCICPISPSMCAGLFFGCLFGGAASRANCCWFGTCVNHLCTEQCPNCCSIPV